MPSKVWYGITYPFPNIIGAAVEVWEWIRNIPYVIMDVITYACWYLSGTMLVKGATGDNIFWIILVSTPTGLHVLFEKKHIFDNLSRKALRLLAKHWCFTALIILCQIQMFIPNSSTFYWRTDSQINLILGRMIRMCHFFVFPVIQISFGKLDQSTFLYWFHCRRFISFMIIWIDITS